MEFDKSHKFKVALTLAGISSFFLFFFLASMYYPGGSNFNTKSVGYNWSENFWCELLAKSAKNSMPNEGRPLALIGMISLSIGVSSFWILISKELFQNNKSGLIVRSLGVISMIFSSFIYTDYHDYFIMGSVASGTIAFGLLFYELKKRSWNLIFFTGIFFLFLIMMNCFIYISEIGEIYLPLLQKFTFIFTLLWIVFTVLRTKGMNHEH